jgi:predicted ATPase
MFKSITLENFFSFGKSTKIELNPGVNVLVGINGSGKSNFIRAIELLNSGLRDGGLKKLINGKWGGVDAIRFSSISRSPQIALDFEIIPPPSQVDPLFPEFKGFSVPPSYQLKLSGRGNADFQFEERLLLNDGENSIIEIDSIPDKMGPVLEPFDFLLIYTQIEGAEQRAIGLHLPIAIYSGFDTTSSSVLRRLGGYQDQKRLVPGGENLIGLLAEINSNDIATFEKISEELRQVNPNFKELAFSTPLAGKTMLAIKEKYLNRTVPIDFISDGTLRFLLLLAILYNPNRGAVVCLDEPEMGLHPDMINSVAKGIKYAAETGTQMIISTHSPLLLNSFELEDLLIFEKDNDNQTVVKRKSEEDFKDWEGAFLAGQMWLRGQLGGVRW